MVHTTSIPWVQMAEMAAKEGAASVVISAARCISAERPIDATSYLMATGLTNAGIGDRLHLAEGTVRNHVTNILGKLGVRDRTQAALKAKELNLI